MATSREMLLTAGGGPRNRRPGHRDRGSTSRTDPDLRSLSHRQAGRSRHWIIDQPLDHPGAPRTDL